MRNPITVVLAAGLALLGAGSLAGAAGNSRPQRNTGTVIAVLGAPVSVPPGRFVRAFAFCPKGYYVTGGGSYSGAVTEIVSSPTSDLRGWFVDGANDARATHTFQHRADAVCMKGRRPVAVAVAASDGLVRHAEIDFSLSHQAPGRH
jgi:hypothetical protein